MTAANGGANVGGMHPVLAAVGVALLVAALFESDEAPAAAPRSDGPPAPVPDPEPEPAPPPAPAEPVQ